MSTARLLPFIAALALLVSACAEPVVAPGTSPAPQEPMPTGTPVQVLQASPSPTAEPDGPTPAPPPPAGDDPYYDY